MNTAQQKTDSTLIFGDYQHTTACLELTKKLTEVVNNLTSYIFEGHCKDPRQWETLFSALGQAIFMKEYLAMCSTDLISISQYFLEQFEDWKKELGQHIN